MHFLNFNLLRNHAHTVFAYRVQSTVMNINELRSSEYICPTGKFENLEVAQTQNQNRKSEDRTKNLKNVMEFFYGSSNDMQASKVHSFDGNISPINAQNFVGRGRFYPGSKTPILDPYASSESTGSSANIVSPLARYLCPGSPVPFATDSPKHRSLVNTSSGSRSGSGGRASRSPLGSLENIEIPLVFRTPVKVEEDVVVMDGILVEPKHGPRAKLSPSTSDSGGRFFSSTSGNDNSIHKSETCRWWEDSGTCRFGSKCRFVHGKEDLRSTAFTNRNQSEALLSRSYGSGSSSNGPRGRSVHHQVHSAASPTEAAAMPTSTTTTTPPPLKVFTKDKEPSSSDSSTTSISTSTISGTDWCPLDDNIEVTLPSSGEKCASRKDVDAHIHAVLYGPSRRKRLPVFVDFVEE